MNYKIIEKENGNRYLIFKEKKYEIIYQRGKFLRVGDGAIGSFLNTNIFDCKIEKFLLKEWVLSCWNEDFGIEIYKNMISYTQRRPNNLFSPEAGCEVFKRDML